jgi:hypothetical protein
MSMSYYNSKTEKLLIPRGARKYYDNSEARQTNIRGLLLENFRYP